MEETGNDKRDVRIQWSDRDPEAGSKGRPLLQRSSSNISIHSFQSRRGQVDPSTVLPIQYRTISFDIAESQGKDAVEIQKAKDSTAKGSHYFLISLRTVSNSGVFARSRKS
jgi:sodium/potassium-transporting ATPase subunit alpha